MASDLLADGNPQEGTVVITDHQTAGKGQRGNRWESEPGKNLTFSVILKPEFLPVAKQFELTVISSLAIVYALREFELPLAEIKWPNDIYYWHQKIGGVLIENSVRANKIEHAIVGIGLNVNQQHFTVEGATSIFNQTNRELPLETALIKLLTGLDRYYSLLRLGRQQELRSLYKQRIRWIDELHVFRDLHSGDLFKGRIVDVSEQGKLLVQVQGNMVTYDFKELAFVE